MSMTTLRLIAVFLFMQLASVAQAQQMSSTLNASPHQPTLEKIISSTSSEFMSLLQSGSEGYLVVMGSFSSRRNAERRLELVRSYDIQARVVNTEDYYDLDEPLWAVVFGPTTRSRAERQLERVSSIVPDAFLRRVERD